MAYVLLDSAAVHALSLISDLQVVILTGSTLLTALCVLALKSLPPVQKPVNSAGAKLKLKVGIPQLYRQNSQHINAAAKGHCDGPNLIMHHQCMCMCKSTCAAPSPGSITACAAATEETALLLLSQASWLGLQSIALHTP